MSQSLEGKVALVTGCGSPSGIGAACVRSLAGMGATVILTDRVGADAGAVAGGIGGNVHAVALDVTDRSAIDTMIGEITGAHGRLDILVNNAGTSAGAKPFLEIKAEDWETSFSVNVKGTADCCQAALPALRQSQGVIVNMSSMVGIGAQRAFGAYTTSKHALIGITKTIAAEFGPDGVRCVAVCPGFIATEFHENVNRRLAAEKGMELEAFKDERYQQVAMRRAGSPEEVGELVAFVCSPAASYITGVALPVTGGVQLGL